MATVLAKFVLVRRWQRLESLVTDITGVYLLSLSNALFPQTDPIQQQHEFPDKPALNSCRFRCQQMSTPLQVLLEADPRLEGNVADDNAIPSDCYQLGQVSVSGMYINSDNGIFYACPYGHI